MLQELDLPAVLATLLIVGALGGSAALWFARLLMPRSAIQQNNPVPPWAIGWVNFGIFICALIVAVYLAQSLSALLLASEATNEDGGAIELTPWLAVVSILLLQLPLLAVFYLSRRYFPHQFAGRLNSEPLPIWTALLHSLPIFLRYPQQKIINHSTICYRKSSALKIYNYDKSFKEKIEGFNLELKMLQKFGMIFNFPEALLNHRLYENQ